MTAFLSVCLRLNLCFRHLFRVTSVTFQPRRCSGHVIVLRLVRGTHLCVVTLQSTGASSKLRVVTLRTSRYTCTGSDTGVRD